MKKILVVEDSDINRQEIVEALQAREACHITEACDGKDGYNILQKDPGKFDLVILDYHMPGMTGINILRKLADESKKVECPVVMITSELDEKGSEVKDLNIVSWVVKPVNKARLANLVSHIFQMTQKAQ